MIAFVGSVFSPYYFSARDLGAGDADEHCALNVALYGPARRKWAFTEYSQKSVRRHSDSLGLGANLVAWDGHCLTCRIDEITAPLPSPLRGFIRLYPEVRTYFSLSLDRHGLHRWQPLIPRGRVEVDLQKPSVSWRGTGYLDSNDGAAPLEEGFQNWTWLRAHRRSETTVIYDVTPASGPPATHAFNFAPTGTVRPLSLPLQMLLPATRWRIGRRTHADLGSTSTVLATLEDGPFYARSLLQTQLCGEPVLAIHESLSLERFRSAWVRALLPFRMRRSRR